MSAPNRPCAHQLLRQARRFRLQDLSLSRFHFDIATQNGLAGQHPSLLHLPLTQQPSRIRVHGSRLDAYSDAKGRHFILKCLQKTLGSVLARGVEASSGGATRPAPAEPIASIVRRRRLRLRIGGNTARIVSTTS